MFITRQCELGDEKGRGFTVVVERKAVRRGGYCALGCAGHDSSYQALAHDLTG